MVGNLNNTQILLSTLNISTNQKIYLVWMVHGGGPGGSS